MTDSTPNPGDSSKKFWTTEQVMQRLKLSNPRPLYQAKVRNEPYKEGKLLALSTGKRNRWLLCQILSSPQDGTKHG